MLTKAALDLGRKTTQTTKKITTSRDICLLPTAETAIVKAETRET